MPAVSPVPDVSGRLAKAGGLMRTGCFDCLEEALAEYDAVRQVPNLRPVDAEAATDGAIGAALLIELRQRELGMTDDGYLQRARELIGTRGDRLAAFAPHLYTVESIPRRDARFLAQTGADGLRRMQELRAKFPALVEERRLGADANPLAAYSWLAFYCTHSDSRDDRSLSTLLGPARPDTRPADRRLSDRHLPGARSRNRSRRFSIANRDSWRSPTGWLRWRWRARRLRRPSGCSGSRSSGGRAGRLSPQISATCTRRSRKTSARSNSSIARWRSSPDHPEALIGRIKALSLLGRPEEAFAAIDAVLAAEGGVSFRERSITGVPGTSRRSRISTWPGPPSNRPTGCG